MEAIKRYHVRLLVTNFRECFLFYRDKPALPVRHGTEHGEYAEFKSDAVHLALFNRDLMAQAAGTGHKTADTDAQDRVAIVLRVDDVDHAFEGLASRGVVFDTAPQDRKAWDCRTALFRDPAGNLLELNGDLQPA
jgi:catechol 2,3-dioxygenase-like lactoylglutathione lyase family enzyme